MDELQCAGRRTKADESDKNLLRIVFFVIGFLVGVMSVKAIGIVAQVVPPAQMLNNACHKLDAGNHWCTGPGAPR
jgi:hypothetical protein